MPYFEFKAVNPNGILIRNVVEAPDADAVYSVTGMEDLHILSVRPVNQFVARLSRLTQGQRVRRKELIEFAMNLSVMLRAGLPLLASLSDIADSTENDSFRQRVARIRSEIALGSSVTDALRKEGAAFPDIFLRLVTVGETTGNLEGSLQDIAGHLQKIERLIAAIKRALLYPFFALFVATGALLFWLIYVLPQVLSIFDDMSVKLPFATRLLVWMSDGAREHWLPLVLLPPFVLVAIKLLNRHPKIAYGIDWLKLRTPILKLVLCNKIYGLFSEQMRILLKAGLTVDRSLLLASEVTGNLVYRLAVEQAQEEILSGASISTALKARELFPPMFIRMVHIGETSGTLDEQFAFLSTHYIEVLDDVSDRLGKMLEPIIIIFLGLIFALIIIGLLLPIYDLVSATGGM